MKIENFVAGSGVTLASVIASVATQIFVSHAGVSSIPGISSIAMVCFTGPLIVLGGLGLMACLASLFS